VNKEFEAIRPQLEASMLQHAADITMGSPCACETGKLRDVKCFDCTQYEVSCRDCFVRDHRNNPFHWAEVWDAEQGFYVRHDMAKVGSALQLGHHGRDCSVVQPSEAPILFTVTHTNGLHSTQVRFCGHQDNNRVTQLMDARLFPSTFTTPASAFTFQVLKEFQIHSLESKVAAFDYVGSLRRLTDNAFPADVTVSRCVPPI
jgi:hypothetical protein